MPKSCRAMPTQMAFGASHKRPLSVVEKAVLPQPPAGQACTSARLDWIHPNSLDNGARAKGLTAAQGLLRGNVLDQVLPHKPTDLVHIAGSGREAKREAQGTCGPAIDDVVVIPAHAASPVVLL